MQHSLYEAYDPNILRILKIVVVIEHNVVNPQKFSLCIEQQDIFYLQGFNF